LKRSSGRFRAICIQRDQEILTMKALPFLIAGAAFAAVAYFIANPIDPDYADSDVERLANKTNTWGAKQRMEGTGGSLLGAAKQKFGEATGDYALADEGAGDQTIGHIKDAAGKIANVASDAVRELNRA
jgi:uncharacterized protein YjbJ (UPF0337 family)